MDETAWKSAARVAELLHLLDGRISERKLRLFACACYRRIWNRLHNFTREVVEVAERLADGLAGQEDLEIAANSAWVWPRSPAPEAAWVASKLPAEAAVRSAEWVAGYVGCQDMARWRALAAEEDRVQCEILRDLVGNPFRTVLPQPSWYTSETVALARALYAGNDFEQIGRLADALAAAGCGNEQVLGHCRAPAVHVRGCWVLDLLLRLEPDGRSGGQPGASHCAPPRGVDTYLV